MEDDTPRLTHNPDDGSLVLQTSGPSIMIEGLLGEVAFERMMPSGESATAVWLEPAEVDVLVKMIRHILENVRIRESSRETLQSLLPRLEALSGSPSSS